MKTSGLSVSGVAILGCGAAVVVFLGVASTARADDDDQKLRDRKPAVVHPIVRYRDPRGGAGSPDATFESKNIELVTWIPLNNFPGYTSGSNGADCWGYVSPSGREYALMGLSWGNGIVEITNPAAPVIRPTIPGSVNVLWRDITVVGNYAYAVSDSSGVGIQVLNLSNIDSGTVTLVGNIMQGGHTTTHTLLSNPASGFLYACGGNANGGGLIPVSTANPNSPVFSGPGWNTQYVHEAQIVNYTSGPYAGKEIAFLFAGGPYYGTTNGFAIVDITNKLAPVQLSLVAYPGIRFCHQGWLSNDSKYVYINDELDSPSQGNVPRGLTRVMDVTDLSNPRLTATFTTGLPSVDHNEYVSGGYLFQSNYTTGMRVFDLEDPLRPVEVAWIDTRPEDNGTGYNGNWGNYPFFPSGTVIASDLERGLFIMKVSLLSFSYPLSLPSVLSPGQAVPVTVQIAQRDATVNPASVKLMVSVNGGPFAAIPTTALGGGNYSGTIPGSPCFSRIRYYVTADTTDGRTFTHPLNAPAETHKATVRTGNATVFSDNFQTNTGWTVQNTSVTAGAWTRAVPAANGGQGAPIGDADGSGMAYITGSGANADLDGGPTRLLSPVFNLATHPEAEISYARWLISVQGVTDQLTVEVSGNNGSTWSVVENVGPSSGGWRSNSFRVADYVTPSAQVRLRFSVSDNPNDSQTEAGVDAVLVTSPACASCYADCNGDAMLNLADFGCFQTNFATGNMYADCNGDTMLNLADFGCFQTKFAVGCP